MTTTSYVRWALDGWRGVVRDDLQIAPHEVLAVVARDEGRRSRHARTQRVELGGGVVYVKAYPAPDGRRAVRAFRMGRALERTGFGAPDALLIGRRGGAGVLVTQDVGGRSLFEAIGSRGTDPRGEKRRLLRTLGAEVGRLHRRGFVHGDLVPSNLVVGPSGVVFLDHDRTRRGQALVWWHARRNLVQLGRFVVPGVTVSDRARVLDAYGAARGFGKSARQRLARWLVRATMRRRCGIDRLELAAVRRAGFRELMRSGGPFDRTDEAGR
jgi:hypothetical protein